VTTPSYHEPVLCSEALRFLLTDPSGVYVDGTVGGGGHAERLCEALHPGGRLVCFDADRDAIHHARERLRDYGNRISFVHRNFGALREELEAIGIGAINGLLLDLGVSSFQIDEPGKGFSFQANGVLDMRFDHRQERTAMDVVNGADEKELERIIRWYGEERMARRIVRQIIRRRPLRMTSDLSASVEAAVGGRFLTKSLARVFQAVRIEVNQELPILRQALHDAVSLLYSGGRLVVISYHSLEDRIVKEVFKEYSARMIPSGHPYVPDRQVTPLLEVLTRKPLMASEDERRTNPRARSAKMRVAERCHTDRAA
jgi:16S rRNA (cytosine1402-N4)-methyltransferase